MILTSLVTEKVKLDFYVKLARENVHIFSLLNNFAKKEKCS